MQAPVIWSSEQLVNGKTDSDQRRSDVIALANGGYVVTWDGYVDPGNSSTLGTYFQVYDAFGDEVGTEQFVDGPNSQVTPNVVPLSGGGFAIVYQGPDEFLSGGVLIATFDEGGASLGPAITVNSEIDPQSAVSQYEPVVAQLSNGGFAVAYFSDDPDGRAVRVQRFDASGAKDGAEMLVAVDPDSIIGDLTIGQIGTGSFALSWTGMDGDFNVYTQIFADDGQPETGIFPLGNTTNNQASSAIASDGTSGLVVYFNASEGGIVGQIFAPDGTLLKPEFLICDNAQNGLFGQRPEVTGLPGGGYFVVWLEYNASNIPQITGQVLDASGNKVGAETVIVAAPLNTDTIFRFSVAALEDGRVAVTYDAELANGGDTSGASVHTLIVDPRGGIIDGTDNSETLLGSTGNLADIITAKGGNDVTYGFAGDDTIYGNAGNDSLDGGDGADSLVGGSGDDFYRIDLADIIVETIGGGNDTIFAVGFDYTLAGGAEIEVLEVGGATDNDMTGNGFSQLLLGDDSNNKLMGMGGNDTLDGGNGFDYMEGGTGDDLYLVDMENEFVIEAANGGTDTVLTKDISFSLEFRDHIENLTLGGSSGIDGLGNGLANVLTGNSNDNELEGSGGNDTLIGMGGADTLRGDSGNDTYVVIDAGDVVDENAGEGTDTVNAFLTYTLTSDVENLNLMGSIVSGTGNELANVLKGNGAGNVLTGLGGNDTLDGLGGNDTMAGGTQNDTYIVGQVGDVVTELANEGADTVIASFNYALGANVENLTLAVGTNATGNGLANAITGNAGANTIDGKAGADTMTGLAGDDQYIVDNTGDVVVEAANGGFDTVTTSVDHTLGAFVEKLVLAAGTNATGNNLANAITGNAGANVIDGKQGNDTMTGLAGDDSYVVADAGDIVVEAASGGTDTVLAFFDYILGDNIENVTLISGSNATGNALANALTGNAGNNKLDGQGGADTMTGGLGNDDYIVASAGDVVVEDAISGIDTVHAAIDYTLGANLETLILTGNAAKGTGNAAANSLIGNALANTLKGGAGNDTMEGGAGKDALEGGKGSDTYVLGGSKDKVTDNKGIDDTITSAITRKLADFAGIENLKLEGTAHINGTGNAADNDLVGNTGKNQLKGEGGNDLIRGLAGADQLWGGGGSDTFDFDATSDIRKAAGKRDIIKDFQHLNDKIDLSTIDANSLLAGDQTFKFKAVEGSAFTGVAGQLIWDQKNAPGTSNDKTLVSGDTNGDGAADFTLELSGLVNLTKADFIL